MSFSPDAAPVPVELRTADFVLRPLLATDAALDFDAVVASQVALRQDNGGRWPRPGFTVEENRADLEGHEADFQARRGFTYTVLDPSERRCLGCVYIYPATDNDDAIADDHAATYSSSQVETEEIGGNPAGAAEVRFWVRPDGVPPNLDQRLLTELLRWLRQDFAFAQLRSPAWVNDARRIAILHESGLREVTRRRIGDGEALFFA